MKKVMIETGPVSSGCKKVWMKSEHAFCWLFLVVFASLGVLKYIKSWHNKWRWIPVWQKFIWNPSKLIRIDQNLSQYGNFKMKNFSLTCSYILGKSFKLGHFESLFVINLIFLLQLKTLVQNIWQFKKMMVFFAR